MIELRTINKLSWRNWVEKAPQVPLLPPKTCPWTVLFHLLMILQASLLISWTESRYSRKLSIVITRYYNSVCLDRISIEAELPSEVMRLIFNSITVRTTWHLKFWIMEPFRWPTLVAQPQAQAALQIRSLRLSLRTRCNIEACIGTAWKALKAPRYATKTNHYLHHRSNKLDCLSPLAHFGRGQLRLLKWPRWTRLVSWIVPSLTLRLRVTNTHL